MLTPCPPTPLCALQVLLVLGTQGCVPLDLLPSMLAAQCGACSAVMALRSVQVRACAFSCFTSCTRMHAHMHTCTHMHTHTRTHALCVHVLHTHAVHVMHAHARTCTHAFMQVGAPCERTCSSCHQRLAATLPAVSFVPLDPQRAGAKAGGPVAAPRMAGGAARRGGAGRGGGGGAFNGVLQVGCVVGRGGGVSRGKQGCAGVRGGGAGAFNGVLQVVCVVVWLGACVVVWLGGLVA